MQTVTPSELKHMIVKYWKANVTWLIRGKPGVAKSDLVNQVSDTLAETIPDWRGIQEFRAVTADPVDLRGFGAIRDDMTKWFRPEFLPREGNGILFLDELLHGTQAMQAGLMSLIYEKQVAGHKLGEGWHIIAATNRSADRAAINRMPSPAKSRVLQVELDIPTKDWLDWAGNNGIHPLIQSFLRVHGELLNTFDPEKDQDVYACARTWEMLSLMLKTAEPTSTELQVLAEGLVGQGPAVELVGFMEIKESLPKMADIIAGTAPALNSPSAIHACGSFMAMALQGRPELREPLAKYIVQFPPEWCASVLREFVKIDPSFTATPALGNWLAEHSDHLVG